MLLIDHQLQDISDEHLIAAVQSGDSSAFSQLMTRYKRKIFQMAARFARDKDELDDLCQEVFIKAYENLGSFRHEAPFEHWLSRVAVRACYDMLRSRRNETRQSNPLRITSITSETMLKTTAARPVRRVIYFPGPWRSLQQMSS